MKSNLTRKERKWNRSILYFSSSTNKAPMLRFRHSCQMIIGPKLSPVDTRHCTISIVPAIPKPPASPNPAQDKSIRPRVSPGRNRICIQCRTLQMTTSRGESPPTFPDTRPFPSPFGPFRVQARTRLFFSTIHTLSTFRFQLSEQPLRVNVTRLAS